VRACLAATLSGLWGVYSGYELLESDPVPGKEEYKDSEKYEIRVRDWNAPGNIVPDITAPQPHPQGEPGLAHAYERQVLQRLQRQHHLLRQAVAGG
jgi:starch synthase (maltosyl-transferring)